MHHIVRPGKSKSPPICSSWQPFCTHSRMTRYGQQSFADSGSTLWNLLPLTIHDPLLSLSQLCARFKVFCACLKVIFVCRAYQTSS